ncbi:hypothetical protein [Sphingomonas sp. Root1294]|uniref:hypothetical protein n=2 Tax=Sphingomonas TaxID=13687 RepID=UPI001F47F9F3|nr:hypothetical protein [Sphingomonas sp. Root1294]
MNLPTAEYAMTLAASTMGDGLLRLPDGEPGPRRGWIFYQRPMFTHNKWLAASPDAARTGIADINAKRVLRSGVRAEEIEFPELGYAREARNSFRWFEQEVAAGRIPAHMRFQVSLPTPYACLISSVEVDTLPQVEPAYEAAMLREIAAICDHIPHDRLAIQWDICLEMLQFDGGSPALPPFDAGAHSGRFKRLTAAVPPGVHLGMHLCYGDFDGKHVIEPANTGKLTAFANWITALSARPLQWIHMPVPVARSDEAYFAPLANLKLHEETELFLGLVHLSDGVEGARRRIDAARRHIERFGISTECGIGRAHTTPEISDLFDIHIKAAREA